MVNQPAMAVPQALLAGGKWFMRYFVEMGAF